MALAMVAGAGIATGFEGVVCLVMSLPLALVLAAMGTLIGRHFAMAGESPGRGAVLVFLLLPGSVLIEGAAEPSFPLREVRTEVEVDAAPNDVWNEVIAFSPLPEPTELLFRLGIAYPLRAEIEGEGVGAIRYCVFSTGSFVEPITAWVPGALLSFDVASSPAPLRELSLWEIAPPHLDGYLVPKRGEFRLEGIGEGRTRLVGTIWYEQRLAPLGYWGLFSDRIISDIHKRVLSHIKGQVEGRTASIESAP